MKNHVRRWWKEHDNPEYCHQNLLLEKSEWSNASNKFDSIVRGTMERMHELARVKGHPISEYYSVTSPLLGWSFYLVYSSKCNINCYRIKIFRIKKSWKIQKMRLRFFAKINILRFAKNWLFLIFNSHH